MGDYAWTKLHFYNHERRDPVPIVNAQEDVAGHSMEQDWEQAQNYMFLMLTSEVRKSFYFSGLPLYNIPLLHLNSKKKTKKKKN